MTFESEHTEVSSKSLEELLKDEVEALKEKVAVLEDRIQRTEHELLEKNQEYNDLSLRYQAVCNEQELTKHALFMKENQVEKLNVN